MDRERWTNLPAAAGYLGGVGLMVWGLLTGDLVLILLGLIIVAIVLVTT